MPHNNSLKTIDLCSGVGGMRKGFELTGKFENVLSAEIDNYACRTYEHLYGSNPFNDLTSEDFKRQVDNTEYDVLLAGFPCQPFSSAGLQKGFNDPTRGMIFLHIAEVIRRTRPKALLLENVSNLVIHDRSRTIQRILNILEDDLDYKVIGIQRNTEGVFLHLRDGLVRNTRDFGIPQNRCRTYIMAFDRQRYGNDINDLNVSLPTSGKCIYEDLNQLLEYGAEAKYYVSSGYLESMEQHRKRHREKGNGFGYSIVNAPGIARPYAHTILATGGSGKERNLVYDPQPGLMGAMVGRKKSPINDHGIRCMTPREWGKLQGFINYAFLDADGTDRFSFPEGVSDTQQYKMFGNAVSIPVIESMAKFMLECMEILDSTL